MKAFYTILSLLLTGLIFPGSATAQNEWPKSFTSSNGDLVKIYQLQPEAFSGSVLEANAAISILKNGKGEPVFGMIWLDAGADTRGQQVDLSKVDVKAIKLPDENDQDALSTLQEDIGAHLTNWNLSMSLNDINTALQLNQQETKLASNLNNSPPKILYADKPSILVVIDGAPKLQHNSKWNVQTVVNTPFIIVKDNGMFFLYGGKHWYTAQAATGPYKMTTNVPNNLDRIQEEVAQANKDNNVQQEEKDYEISNVIVSTEPAELLQSDGEPNFTAIQGTNLLYIKNSNNDIFMDVTGQQYYVLLSGRWYRSSALDGTWQFMAADRLPADFAKIPEGSPKDNVLASVAGTVAAQDAVMDAQVPQTAKVDRSSASANIDYDGDPQFNNIDGTDMDYAINTSAYVLRWRGSYYAVDNGVWFQSYSPNGPWRVSTERPYVVSMIPPRYPVYAMKYVYIYDVTPDYIYMGYTPGYLNTFVYGPTVVYGTGYYYRPWFGNYYYARPYTWGFNMHYSPWTGWGFGFNYNVGWFNFSIGNYSPWGYYGGWWGPTVYRPSYCWAPYRGGYHGGYYGGYYGYYGRRNTVVINNNINVYRNNNIYNRRAGVVTRDNRRIASSYNRNLQSSQVRTAGNSRPVERNVTRNSNYNNNRPTVGRNVQSGNYSPRSAVSGRTASENRPINNGRPGRTFETSSQNNSARTQQAGSASQRINSNSSDAQRRQIAEQRNLERRSSQRSAFDANRQQAPQRPAREQPVRRNFEPSRQSQPAPQRVERSASPSRSSGGAERSGRSSGGESRARRG